MCLIYLKTRYFLGFALFFMHAVGASFIFINKVLSIMFFLISPLLLGYFYSSYYKKYMDKDLRDKTAIIWAVLHFISRVLFIILRINGGMDQKAELILVDVINTLFFAAIMFWFMAQGSKLYFKIKIK